MLKFHRPGGDVHAYVYREAGRVRASVFVLTGGSSSRDPLVVLDGATEDEVDAALRRWVNERFPKD